MPKRQFRTDDPLSSCGTWRATAVTALIVFCLLTALSRPSFAQSQPTGVVLVGTAVDATGGALQEAGVDLIAASGHTIQTTTTDAAGAFRFERVVPGDYQVRAQLDGFDAATARVRIGDRQPAPLKLVMALATFKQEITIAPELIQVKADVSSNMDATTIDRQTLESLPMLDQGLMGTLSRFLDPAAMATGSTTIIVDGLETSSLNIPTSSIQQVKINSNPYSAEFARPGTGRIEVVTASGSAAYRGNATVSVRNSIFDARNAFATSRPPEQHRMLEGFLSGPVPHTKTTFFNMSATHRADEVQAFVVAQTLSGRIQSSLAAPYTYLSLTGMLNHQSARGSSSLRVAYEGQSARNQGIGGVTLPEAATNWDYTEQMAAFSHQTVLSSKLLNQFRLQYTHFSAPSTSVTVGPRIVVADAFIGGGAQGDMRRTKHGVGLVDTLSWSSGRHLVKVGLDIPDWSWRTLDDDTNTAGTFYFSSLADYAAQRPYAFIQQLGNGHVAFGDTVLGAFVQDEIRVRPDLSVAVGLRYDRQASLGDNNNVAPRAAFAFTVPKTTGIVIRGGAGLFYDRMSSESIEDLIRYDREHVLRYVIEDPGYPNALRAGQTLVAEAPSLVRFAPDINTPSRLQLGIGVERQLAKSTTMNVTYTRVLGFDMFRSRDINAPTPPLYQVRPDATVGVLRQIESAGTFRSQSLQFSLRGQVTHFFNGTAQYTLSRAFNDTSGTAWMPPNAYDLSQEYARADSDQRHRVNLIGTLKAGSVFNFGVALNLSSGPPYSVTTGYDDFHTGQGNARPSGVARNSLEGPGNANLDLRWSRELWRKDATKKQGPAVTLGVDAFNVLNRVNYDGYVGTLSSPFFGQAVSAKPPRRMQFSLKFQY